MKNKVKLILGALFILQCLFVFVNFVYLLANGGEMIVTEHIKLDDGTYVEKAALTGLSTEDIAYIKAHGVDAFNALKQQEAEQFKATHKIIGEQAMAIEDWNNLSEEYKAIAEAQGFDFLQARIEADRVKFEKQYKKLATGEYIPYWSSKDEDGNKVLGYNDLTAEQQEYIYNNGVDKFNEKYGNKEESYEDAVARLLALNKAQQQLAIRTGLGGYTDKTWDELTSEQKITVIEDFKVRFPAEAFGEGGNAYVLALSKEFMKEHYWIPTIYNQKVLIFEVIVNGFILIFSIICGSWFIHEYIKEIKAGK